MKELILYGNCHCRSLTKVLETSEEFNEKYKITCLIVHEAKKEEFENFFDKLAPQADVIIYQNVSSNYRGMNGGSSRFDPIENPLKIKLTNAYYSGYFPDFGYLYDKGEHIDWKGIAAQDLNFFYRWMIKKGGVHKKELWKWGGETLPIYDVNFYRYIDI